MENDVALRRMFLAGLAASALIAVCVALCVTVHHGLIFSALFVMLFSGTAITVMKLAKAPAAWTSSLILVVLFTMLASYYTRVPNFSTYYDKQPAVSWQLSARVAAIGFLAGVLVNEVFLLWGKRSSVRRAKVSP